MKKKSKLILKNWLLWPKSKDLPLRKLKKFINSLMSKLLLPEPLKKPDNWLIIKPKWQ